MWRVPVYRRGQETLLGGTNYRTMAPGATACPNCGIVITGSFHLACSPCTYLSYPGTPYARRFHKPGGACACEGCSQSGRQLHAEPLFLDCCGLVRRVMRRMRKLLGFRLGPGNQSYQVRTGR